MENNTDKNNGDKKKVGFIGFLGEIFSKRTMENTSWEILFKILLVFAVFLVPTIFGWMVWTTSETFANQASRTTVDKIQRDVDEINNKLTTLPPQDWRDRIVALEKMSPSEIHRRLDVLEAEQKLIRAQLLMLETKNSEDHTKILVLLENIKGQLTKSIGNDKQP